MATLFSLGKQPTMLDGLAYALLDACLYSEQDDLSSVYRTRSLDSFGLPQSIAIP